jgi:hypothetical protein
MRDFSGLGADLPLDDAAIPNAVEVVLARSDLADAIAASVIREGDVERLMQVADPVAQELERLQPGDGIARRAENLEVSRDRRQEALCRQWTARGSEPIEVSRHVDEVLARPLAWLVRTGTRVGEEAKLRVLFQQPTDRLPGRLQLLEGHFTDDLVAEFPPRLCGQADARARIRAH